MGKVYIEIFIAENILINYLVLYLTDRFLLKKSSHKHLFMGAAAGCAYAVVSVLGIFPYSDNIIFKIIIAVIMCLLAFGTGKIISILKNLFSVFMFTFLLGGIAFAFINISGGSITSKGIVMHSEEFVFLILGVFTGFLLAELFIRQKKRLDIQKELIYEITLRNRGKSITVSAFFDTGNNLYDNNDNPVTVVEYETVKQILCESELNSSHDIPFATVNGVSTISILRIDALEFSSGSNICMDNVSIALYFGQLSPEKRFNALLGPGILFAGN